MTEPSFTARFEVNDPHVVAEIVDDEVVVVDLRSGYYYSLVGTASFVWTALAAGKTLAEIQQAVNAAYDQPEENIEAALETFTCQLVREGLLRATERAPSTGVLPVPASRTAYQRPVLEKFTDMKEFLLVDPIHEVNVRGWPHMADDAQKPPSDQDKDGKK